VIVKIQLPISSADRRPMALVYNRTRSTHFLVEVDSDLLKLMSPDPEKKPEPKLFFNAHMEGEKLFIDGQADWQEW